MLDVKPEAIDFVVEPESGYQRVFSKLPLLTSLTAGWNDIFFVYDYLPPGETPEVASKQHGIAIFTDLPTPAQAERMIDGQVRHEQVVAGDIIITPAHINTYSRWNVPGGVILLGFEQATFAHAVYEAIAPHQVELLPHFATADPLIQQMGLALKSVLEKDASGSRLYADAMANALLIHLLQHYAARQPKLRNYTNGLSRLKLRQVIDYIQTHLDQDLGLSELAAIAQMSSHYFSKLFKQSTGITPHQYVICCRVERAKELLRRGVAIADVATQVGFVDQSHLNRHFKRSLGITPKDFCKR